MNTQCDTSPSALTDAFAAMGMPKNQTVSHTCIDSTSTVISSGRERCFYTYVPPCAGLGSPLVYDIHGAGLCPLWNFETTQWMQKAMDYCFVLVWPLGNTETSISAFPCWAVEGGLPVQPPESNQTYVTNDCCCFAIPDEGNATAAAAPPPPPLDPYDTNVTDDLTFLRNVAAVVVPQVADESNGTVTIDAKRIYLGGHSNGCAAALAMAAVHPDMVTAVCCHSPALIHPFHTQNGSDYASSPVPMWIVHGKRDGTVAYNGSKGPFSYPGALQVNDILGGINGCVGNVSETVVLSEDGSPLSETRRQTNCTNNATVELLTLETAGHTPYLGAPVFDQGQNPDSSLGAQVTMVDTTELAWAFCSAFIKDLEPLLVQVHGPTAAPATKNPSTTAPGNAPTTVPSSTSAASPYSFASWDALHLQTSAVSLIVLLCLHVLAR